VSAADGSGTPWSGIFLVEIAGTAISGKSG
jgi:hypothetical protein